MTTKRSTNPSARFIARQVGFGFGAVSIVAVAMCAMFLIIINDVSRLVASMRHDESSIRQGLDLATSVREMSIHIAHTVIEGDASHREHYEEWREQVQTQIQELSSRVPEQERYHLTLLREKTQRMHDLAWKVALPAAQRGDLVEVRRIHHDIDKLGQDAATHADALARATTSQMAHAHVLATDATRIGLIGGGLCVLLVLALSMGFTVRLRAAVLRPLVTLTEAAHRFGKGDFGFRVGPVGKGELAALGDAFDRMADELARREAQLLQNERMAAIGQLAAGVAHELNNPIGIIRGYLKTMDPDADVQTLREELAILDEEASHCQRIAEDLLVYARADELATGPVEMGEFLTEAAKRFESSAQASGMHVHVDVEDISLEADSTRLRQVVLNLLTNAGQASPPDATVHLRGRTTAAGYAIEIEDHGPGIEKEDQARVFEPFFSKRRGGSGLGLSVCQGIVRAHGGSIGVRRGTDGGALFTVTLPIRKGDADE